MKKLFLAIAALALMSTSAMAEVKPGCIGGCMGTAIAAPTPVFPVGYMCNTNWPLGSNQVPCATDASRAYGYDTVTTVTIHHPPSPEHPTGYTSKSTGRYH